MSPVCKCNYCDGVFEDTNPNEGQLETSLNLRELKTGEDENGFFKGCPDCGTDGFLMDVYEEKEVIDCIAFVEFGKLITYKEVKFEEMARNNS